MRGKINKFCELFIHFFKSLVSNFFVGFTIIYICIHCIFKTNFEFVVFTQILSQPTVQCKKVICNKILNLCKFMKHLFLIRSFPCQMFYSPIGWCILCSNWISINTKRRKNQILPHEKLWFDQSPTKFSAFIFEIREKFSFLYYMKKVLTHDYICLCESLVVLLWN